MTQKYKPNAKKRKSLKKRIFHRDGWKNEDDEWRAFCAFGCGVILTFSNASLDRYPIPGCDGGEYTYKNLRLACRPCNCAGRNVMEKPTKNMRRGKPNENGQSSDVIGASSRSF